MSLTPGLALALTATARASPSRRGGRRFERDPQPHFSPASGRTRPPRPVPQLLGSLQPTSRRRGGRASSPQPSAVRPGALLRQRPPGSPPWCPTGRRPSAPNSRRPAPRPSRSVGRPPGHPPVTDAPPCRFAPSPRPATRSPHPAVGRRPVPAAAARRAAGVAGRFEWVRRLGSLARRPGLHRRGHPGSRPGRGPCPRRGRLAVRFSNDVVQETYPFCRPWRARNRLGSSPRVGTSARRFQRRSRVFSAASSERPRIGCGPSASQGARSRVRAEPKELGGRL